MIRIIDVKKPSNNRNFENKYKCCSEWHKIEKRFECNQSNIGVTTFQFNLCKYNVVSNESGFDVNSMLSQCHIE